MKNLININGNGRNFQYLLEFLNEDKYTSLKTNSTAVWAKNPAKKDTVCLIYDSISCVRNENTYILKDSITDYSNEYIPNTIKYSKLRVYIPPYSLSIYNRGIIYACSCGTWINGYKIDLGTFIFRPTDTVVSNNIIKRGNNEYYEYVEFDIIDPFQLIYSDDWQNFRHNITGEPLQQNSMGSILVVSLYPVNFVLSNEYLIDSNFIGGTTAFNISKPNDFLSLCITQELDPLRLRIDVNTNSVYNWLLTYLKETYNINTTTKDIYFELIIKNKDTGILGPRYKYAAKEDYGIATQYIDYETLMDNFGISTFFSNWNDFEEGWSFVMSLNIIDTGIHDEDSVITINRGGLSFDQYTSYTDASGVYHPDFKESDDIEILNIVSNEIPITMDLFSRYVNNGSEKIIDINNMNIDEFKSFRTYNVVNKVENKIYKVEKSNFGSKSGGIQPVFFRTKDSETLTLHPNVTENICINLDDYKSKVKAFILQINGVNFNQIGANTYGMIFKIKANSLPKNTNSGVYYILNEEMELVTTGKYNCVK